MTAREQRPVTKRGKRARSDAQRNRERIFAAAKGAFDELGSEAGMDEIARRAGVGVGTLYRHFLSRAELVEAVYDDMVSGLAEQATILTSAEDPWEALALWLEEYVRQLQAKRLMLSELRPLFDQHPEILRSSQERADAALRVVLEPAQEAGVARRDLVPSDLILLMNAVAGAAGEPARSQVMLDAVLHGIRTHDL